MADSAIVARALHLFAAGKTYQEIARGMGVSRQYVHQLIGPLVTGAARVRRCRSCGNKFQLKTSKKYCAACAAKRAAASSLAATYTKCACGRRKTRKARRCRACQFGRVDIGLAAALYEAGYSAANLGGYFGVTKTAIYKALQRGGASPGHIDRYARLAFELRARPPIEEAAADILKQRTARRQRGLRLRAVRADSEVQNPKSQDPKPLQKRKTQNAKRKMQNAKRKMQNAKRKIAQTSDPEP
jgi:predicted DNA-binding protein YlxM (UPF0122 family)